MGSYATVRRRGTILNVCHSHTTCNMHGHIPIHVTVCTHLDTSRYVGTIKPAERHITSRLPVTVVMYSVRDIFLPDRLFTSQMNVPKVAHAQTKLGSGQRVMGSLARGWSAVSVRLGRKVAFAGMGPTRLQSRRSFGPLAWYNRQLQRSPIITKCITSGGLLE